jgi:hypothetical protein
MDRDGVALDNRIAGRIARPEMLVKSEPAEIKPRLAPTSATVKTAAKAFSLTGSAINGPRLFSYSPSTSFMP